MIFSTFLLVLWCFLLILQLHFQTVWNSDIIQKYHIISQTLVILINPDDQSSSYIQSERKCVSVAFHPNNRIMFLLSTNNCVECWDYVAKKCLHTFQFSGLQDIEEIHWLQKRLALSFCSRFLNIAFYDRCARVHLPYEVFYGKNATQQLLSTLWALQNRDFLLPKDVIREIVKKLIDVLVKK